MNTEITTTVEIGQIWRLNQKVDPNPFAKPKREHFIKILATQGEYVQFFWWTPEFDGMDIPEDAKEAEDVYYVYNRFQLVDLETATNLFVNSRKGKLF